MRHPVSVQSILYLLPLQNKSDRTVVACDSNRVHCSLNTVVHIPWVVLVKCGFEKFGACKGIFFHKFLHPSPLTDIVWLLVQLYCICFSSCASLALTHYVGEVYEIFRQLKAILSLRSSAFLDKIMLLLEVVVESIQRVQQLALRDRIKNYSGVFADPCAFFSW